MRSEERAGIISIIMLFLWGTLITEPFHIFVRFIATVVQYAGSGIGANGIALSLITYVVIVSVIILLQKFESTRVGIFMPCVISTVFIAMLVIRSIINRSVGIGDAICLAIPAAVGLAFYIFKFEDGLKWFNDTYTYSTTIALVNSLLFVPLSKLNGVLGKLLYITRYNDLNITQSFAGVAGIPEVVWGLFLTAFAVLPIIYLATIGRRK